MQIQGEPASFPLLDGKLRLYRRKESPHWQCAAYLASKNWRTTTRETDFARARDVAEDWYVTLRAKIAAGLVRPLRRFQDTASAFQAEYEVATRGQRNPAYVQSHRDRIRLYLNPFFGDMDVGKITTGRIVEFRVWRQKLAMEKHGKPAARNTIQNDIVTLRMVMKLAERKGWIGRLPDFSEPYRPSAKIAHRAWFSAKEYFRLCQATWRYAQNPPNEVRPEVAKQLHDYVVLMANTGLRPDEASHLEFRDIAIDDEETEEPILVLDVRGKRGVGYCKSMPSAVRAFDRILKRASQVEKSKPLPTDKVFPLDHRALFNRILVELDLKRDREGLPRTAYSLRHTYICLRLLNGANIFQIAMNCRTSVEMIEKFYAVHISTHIDTARLNVGRSHEVPDDEMDVP